MISIIKRCKNENYNCSPLCFKKYSQNHYLLWGGESIFMIKTQTRAVFQTQNVSRFLPGPVLVNKSGVDQVLRNEHQGSEVLLSV